MEQKRNGIMFFDSYFDVLDILDDKDVKPMLRAIRQYALNDNLIDMNQNIKLGFFGIKHNIDYSIELTAKRKKSGAKGGKAKASKKDFATTCLTDKEKDKEKERDKDIDKENISCPQADGVSEDGSTVIVKKQTDNKTAVYSEIISYLNMRAGTNYKATSETTKRHINARLSEGYTLDDFKTVIDKKCVEWQNSDMAKYLRPETLFGNKFENYLNQAFVKKKSESGNTFIDMLKEEIGGS